MRKPRKRRLMGEINVVPYIDVMLVLLVIFMVTAPLLTQGIEVQLPQAAADPIVTQQNQEPLVLSIDADGDLYLSVGDDEDAPLAAERVVELAAAVLRRNPADAGAAQGGPARALWRRRPGRWCCCSRPGPPTSAFSPTAPASPRRRS